MSRITKNEGDNTNVACTEFVGIKLWREGTIALTQDDQDGENTGKETAERISCGFVRQFLNTSALTKIGTTETDMDSTDTGPTDETCDSRKRLEPDKGFVSTRHRR